MKYLYLLIVMMTSVVLVAADRVGKVTSSGPVTLNGKAVPATAVSSLPLEAGDEIATTGSSAVISFTDRSRATLEPNSRVKLEVRSSSVTLRVLSGSVDLNRAKGSRVSVIQPVHPVAPNSAVGQASDESAARPDNDPKPHPRSHHCPPNKPHCD